MPFTYLRLIGGRLKEFTALVVSAGAGDAGKIPALDASGKLDSTLMPTGIGAPTKSINASENLAAGPVNLFDDSGTLKARKADASAVGKEANGFVLGVVTAGQPATVYFAGEMTGLTGLTRGARYYLSDTPGAVVDTPPTGTGKVVQFLGVAVGTTSLFFEPGEPVELA